MISFGKKIAELINLDLSAGDYTIDFSASNLSTGLYIYFRN